MKLGDEELREIKRKLLYFYAAGKTIHYITENKDRIDEITFFISSCNFREAIREIAVFANGCMENLLGINSALFM